MTELRAAKTQADIGSIVGDVERFVPVTSVALRLFVREAKGGESRHEWTWSAPGAAASPAVLVEPLISKDVIMGELSVVCSHGDRGRVEPVLFALAEVVAEAIESNILSAEREMFVVARMKPAAMSRRGASAPGEREA